MKTLNKYKKKIIDFFDPKGKLKKTYHDAPFPKVKSKKRFIKLIMEYIFGVMHQYKVSANTIFDKSKDAKAFYKLIKQDKYDFSDLLTKQSYQLLGNYLDQFKKHKCYDSWCTNHRITIVLDKMECPRTSGNHEKSKKLHKSENGHYLINLAIVVGDNKSLFDLDSLLYDPECGRSSIEIALEMLKKCVSFVKSRDIDMDRFRFTADREFLTKEIVGYCKEENLRFVTRAKGNTVFYDSDFKFNARWLKRILYKYFQDDFKTSSQLDSWSHRHKKPKYEYWSGIYDSNFGKVKVVAVKVKDRKLTDSNYGKGLHILISFDPSMTAVQIIQTYKGQRWQIEVFHRSYKRDIEVVTSYIGLSFIGLRNHYILRSISYLYLAKIKCDKASWKNTIGQIKRQFSKLE